MAVTQDKPKEVKDGKGKKKDEEKEPELSEEDQQLKSNLELMVERTCEPDTGASCLQAMLVEPAQLADPYGLQHRERHAIPRCACQQCPLSSSGAAQASRSLPSTA